MKKYFLPFIFLFVLTPCFSQQSQNTEQELFEEFLKSEKIIEHFINKKEIYILKDRNLCEKIDCDKSYVSKGKKVNIWERADYFSRALRDYVIIKKIDTINNNVDFYFNQ